MGCTRKHSLTKTRKALLMLGSQTEDFLLVIPFGHTWELQCTAACIFPTVKGRNLEHNYCPASTVYCVPAKSPIIGCCAVRACTP
jgi:hypothetical protein